MIIHHIGYLVKNITKAKGALSTLGFIIEKDIVYDEYRKVDIAFMVKDGYRVELVSPTGNDSVVSNLMAKYKNSPYHICYEVESIEDAIKYLAYNKYIQIDEPLLAPAIEKGKVCFMHNPQIGIVELLERNK